MISNKIDNQKERIYTNDDIINEKRYEKNYFNYSSLNNMCRSNMHDKN